MEDCKYQAYNGRCNWHKRHADSDYSSTLPYFGKTWEFDNMDELREFYYNNIKKGNK